MTHPTPTCAAPTDDAAHYLAGPRGWLPVSEWAYLVMLAGARDAVVARVGDDERSELMRDNVYWQEGYRHGYICKPRTSNPCEAGTPQWREWDDGWRVGDRQGREINERECREFDRICGGV